MEVNWVIPGPETVVLKGSAVNPLRQGDRVWCRLPPSLFIRVELSALKYLIAVALHQRQRWPSFMPRVYSCRKGRIETMAIDWLATLAEQGDIAKSKATEVATLVVKPELPLEIASRLYRDVEKGAQTFDRILSDMEDADVSDELLEAADALAELWTQLSVASANKLRELQGLPPIMMREAPH